MRHLLIADTSYQRIRPALETTIGNADIRVVTVNKDGVFLCEGEPIDADKINVSILRLDWDLLVLGQMKAILGLVERASNLEFVQTAAAGLDNPIFARIIPKARAFCNSDAQAPAIAEYVVASVLNRWQRFDTRMEHQRQKRWQSNSFKEVLESNWLIIGFGNIGQWVARQIGGFGAHVTAVRRNLSAHPLAETVDSLDNLSQYLGDADVIVLACALNEETKGLVNSAFLQQLKPDAVLVNIARGGVVDEDALLNALDNDQLDFAVLDVFETEPLPETHAFWTHEKVLVTPHSSNAGLGTMRRGDELFLENLARYQKGEPLRNLVDSASL